MRNKILILISIVSLILIVLVAMLFSRNKQNLSNSSAVSTTIMPSTPTGSKISIPSRNTKSNIPVDNYYIASSSIVIDEKDVLIEKNEKFDILGYNYNNEITFLIYLKKSSGSLETTRQNAENVFIEKLGITREQACLLIVSERLANDIEGANAEEYGLSFCPNNKNLPGF